MRISQIIPHLEAVPLTQPYTIAYKHVDSVFLVWLEIHTDEGLVGLGASNPSRAVVHEGSDDVFNRLQNDTDWLIGQDIRRWGIILQQLAHRYNDRPGTRAALDIALHDLWAQSLQHPLVDVLGRCHETLPTSITIGIKPVDETVAEAAGYLRQGFQYLKVKLGQDAQTDIQRLQALRREFGTRIWLRVDANQGYTVEETEALVALATEFQLELIEQPLPREDVEIMRNLPLETRSLIAADESLRSPADALNLLQPIPTCGIFNIKLMKAGGISPALDIARLAALKDRALMWGCNDESRISIAAALHTAFACPHTRFLDLDGSFDLTEDPAEGGFTVENGMMRLLDRPGLGVQKRVG